MAASAPATAGLHRSRAAENCGGTKAGPLACDNSRITPLSLESVNKSAAGHALSGACVRAGVRACVRACACRCWRVECVCVRVDARVRVHVYACVRVIVIVRSWCVRLDVRLRVCLCACGCA